MKVYNKPDLNAPRFRHKRLNILNQQFVDKLKTDHPALSGYSAKQIKQVVTVFNELIRDTVLENRDGVELMEQLGHIFIGTCPRKAVPDVDYATSKALGVEVRHMDMQTDGKVAKIFYTNYSTKYRFRFHELWMFDPGRDFTRATHPVYLANWQKFRVIDNKLKLAYLYRAGKAKQLDKEDTEQLLLTYDEFDL